MLCALSGTTPEEPVVSTKSGHVYEKRLIEKWLDNNAGRDPVTQEPLSRSDLVEIKVSKTVKPRPTTATSVPGLLSIFQNEWDALMLETYTLKQQLESVRQELSQALYQHDAACRVIARLVKERDEARNALANTPRAAAAAPEAMEVETPAGQLSEEVKTKMQAKSQELSKERKKRQAPATLSTDEDLKHFTALSSNPVHKASNPGILCVDIHPNQELIATGGVDKNVVIFDRSASKIAHTLSAHSKRVNDVLFHPSKDVILSGSADKTAVVWSKNGKDYAASHTVTAHSDDVTSVTLHATGDYWVSASLDKTWAFHDLTTATTLAQTNAEAGITCTQFHPDGLIIATGTQNSTVKIWDAKGLKNVATFEGHKGALVDVAFSENGYYLATAAEDNVVKLWDLRKLTNFHSLNLSDNYNVSAIAWDYTGTYLAVAGKTLDIYQGKALDLVVSLSEHSDRVTDVKFGEDSQFLVSTSMDRSLKVWGKSVKKSKK